MPKIDLGKITGESAGFGSITAEVSNTTGIPSVSVETSGTDEAKNIHFSFTNLKGGKGDPGEPGSDASVDVPNTQIPSTEAENRTNIANNDTIKIAFGKLRKWFSDLKTVAFTGSYNDLEDKPTIPSVDDLTGSITTTRVKGNNETVYRSGDVNLTCENLGAMPISGGIFTGDVGFNKYMTIRAWEGYGTGTAQAWYNGNTKTIDYVGNVTDIDLRSADTKKVFGMTQSEFLEYLGSNISISAVALSNVQNLSAESTSEGIKLSWQDPDDIIFNGITTAQFEGTKVQRKTGSYPTSETDGTTVTDTTQKNQYSETPLLDTGVEDGITYFYTLFPHTTDGVYTQDDKNRISQEKVGVDNVLNNNDWSTIISICEAGQAANYWSVGDTKTFVGGDGKTREAKIVGFDHDVLSNDTSKRAGCTFAVDMIYTVLWGASSARGYNESGIYEWIRDYMESDGYILNYFSEEFVHAVKKINKNCVNRRTGSVHNISGKLFPFSCYELTGSASYPVEGNVYEYFQTNDAKKIGKNYWTRTAGTTGYAYCVTSTGMVSDEKVSAYLGTYLCFCI